MDGSNLRADLLIYPPVVTESEFRYYAEPVWAADSGSLRVAIPPAEPYLPDATLSTWFIPVDGSPATMLAAFAAEDRDFRFPAVFSPDLARIAFLTAVEEGLALHLAKVDGSEDVIYASGSVGFDIVWIDAEHFTFGLDTGLQVGHIDGTYAPLEPVVRGSDPTITALLAAGC